MAAEPLQRAWPPGQDLGWPCMASTPRRLRGASHWPCPSAFSTTFSPRCERDPVCPLSPHHVGDLILHPLSSAGTSGSFPGLEQHSSAVLSLARPVCHEALRCPSPAVFRCWYAFLTPEEGNARLTPRAQAVTGTRVLVQDANVYTG